MHWRLSIPQEPDSPLHDASDIEFITGAHVDARHSTPTERFHCFYHLVNDVTSVSRDASSELLLLSRSLRILAGGTFESDVEASVNPIFFSHLPELGGDVFVHREIKRSEGYQHWLRPRVDDHSLHLGDL